MQALRLIKRSVFVSRNAEICRFDSSESWVILSPIEQSIKHKIERAGTPLKDWDINIYRGVLTGFNEAFIISGSKREEILAACKTESERSKTAEIIRPILRGRDIKRYSYNFSNQYIIATFPSRHYDIEEFPALKKYFLAIGVERLEQSGKTHIINGKEVKSRKKTNNKWFETQDCINYWEDFSKQKIIYPNMSKFLPFFLDKNNFLTNQKCFILTGRHLAFLTAFFNSSVFKYCFRDSFPELQGGTRELSKIFFERIPVILIDEKTDQIFQNLLESIQRNYTREKAIEIDQKIFDLYALSEEERRAIGFIEISSERKRGDI